MYEFKKNEPFYYTLLLMNYLHYYPLGVKEKNLKYYHAVSVLIRMLSSIIFIELGLHCILSLKNQIPVDPTEDIADLLGLGHSMFVSIMFGIRIKRWSSIFSDITDTTKFGTPRNFTDAIKKANTYSLIYFFYCIVGILIYGLVSNFDTGSCTRLNKEKDLHEICGLFASIWWPKGEMSLLSKAALISYQYFAVVYYIPSSAMLCFVAWEVAEIIIAKIHHLKELFEDAFNTKNKDLQAQRLKLCIRYHQEIIRIAENLNEATKWQCGFLSCVGAVILSCIGTQLLKEYFIGALLHLIGYVVAIYLLCQTGQRIRDETYDIQDAVYASKWYEANPNLAKDTQLILLRCQKPIELQAVPFGVFNYNLLIIILKTSYSYLTLINNTSEEAA